MEAKEAERIYNQIINEWPDHILQKNMVSTVIALKNVEVFARIADQLEALNREIRSLQHK